MDSNLAERQFCRIRITEKFTDLQLPSHEPTLNGNAQLDGRHPVDLLRKCSLCYDHPWLKAKGGRNSFKARIPKLFRNHVRVCIADTPATCCAEHRDPRSAMVGTPEPITDFWLP